MIRDPENESMPRETLERLQFERLKAKVGDVMRRCLSTGVH